MQGNTTTRAGHLDRRSHRDAPAIARCPHCPAELDLAELDHETIGAGERGYRCPACRGTVVLYSAAWLDNTTPEAAAAAAGPFCPRHGTRLDRPVDVAAAEAEHAIPGAPCTCPSEAVTS